MYMLDNLSEISAIDRSGMLDTIAKFPEQIEESIGIAKKLKVDIEREIDKILISGMGGSAISGDIVQGWLRDSTNAPIFVNREYTVPKWVDNRTLSIFLSYSGNTEETLSAMDDAHAKGSMCIGISSGGLLKEKCEQYSYPHLQIPSGFQPRAATAYLLFPTIVLLKSAGVISYDISNELNETIEVTRELRNRNKKEILESENQAKQIAETIYETIPNIYGWNYYAPIAKRWRTQLNENSKVIARDDIVSECNHNDIVGWSFDPEVSKKSSCVLLRDTKHEPTQVSKRFEFMKKLFNNVAANTVEVNAIGETLLARMISLMYIGDFVSIYLALLRKVDPTPVDIITELKTELAR
ncbi:MAG TPA: bifunctional phosphoglucose/phosphomannose isomerase [Thermoplasmatales archaeon]|nr:bifunctional phosphoglucose/phosphomannose isomerase [Thermoplasmatales archaeon]